jgi:hypothetical protein
LICLRSQSPFFFAATLGAAADFAAALGAALGAAAGFAAALGADADLGATFGVAVDVVVYFHHLPFYEQHSLPLLILLLHQHQLLF